MELFGKRVDSIRDAITPTLSTRQRMAQENIEMSRLTYYRELVSIADETLFKLASVLYEVDDQGVLINVDPVTHRILLPLPWAMMAGVSGKPSATMRQLPCAVCS